MVSIKSIKVQTKNESISSQLLVFGLKEGDMFSGWGDDASSDLKKAISVASFTGKSGKTVHTFGNDNIQRVSVYGLGKEDKLNSDRIREIASKISMYANSHDLKDISVDGESFGLDSKVYAQAFAEGLVLGAYEFLDYKSKKKNSNTLVNVFIYGDVDINAVTKGEVIGNGVAYARDLGNHPANTLTPAKLAEDAVEIGNSAGMKSTIIDVSEFQNLIGS